MSDVTPENFGCERCWPASAEECYKALGDLAFVRSLIDESHFIVNIRSCRQCRQKFLLVFTELIDWEGGDDSQCMTLLPISEIEASTLVSQGGSISEATLRALGIGRKSLGHIHARGEADATTYWATGILVLPHD
jgi:hypothetical protein